jgi:hypothetical protein
MSFDFSGKPKWRKLFEEGIQHFRRYGRGLFCADRNGRCFVIDPCGAITAEWKLEKPLQCTCAMPNGILAAAGDSLYWLEDTQRSG